MLACYRVLEQIEEANAIKTKLDEATMRRVMVALRTPNATFSASDAFQILTIWNITGTTTFLERAKLKNPVDKRIEDLEAAEDSLGDKELELEAAVIFYRDSERDLQKARADRVLAVQAEKRAKEALARAQRQVSESKARVNNTTKMLSQAEVAFEKIFQEQERMATAVAKQQEDVRKSILARKEVSAALKEEDIEEEINLSVLQELETEEAKLVQEYSRLEVAASQLQERANGLRDRAEQLKSEQ